MDLLSFKRHASLAEIGGVRPAQDPLASRAGRVRVAVPGEQSPTTGAEPMLPLARLNLTEASCVPPVLADVAILTLFVGPYRLPVDDPNATNWELRAYRSLVLDDAGEAPKPHSGLKFGGWPLCVQSELQWSGLDGVEFALQIDGDNRFGFEVGYGGVFYIGRRRIEGQDTWHADWQAM